LAKNELKFSSLNNGVQDIILAWEHPKTTNEFSFHAIDPGIITLKKNYGINLFQTLIIFLIIFSYLIRIQSF